jgi:NAD(P)-dependent dehydrogenase (short-subunit alcohol dehydrogenase family)
MSEFNGKVVVVTGGNSGIGQAIAEKFDREGAKIVIFGRDQQKLDHVCKGLNQAFAVQGDIQKLADIKKLFKLTQDKFGKIDVLIANAGIASLRLVDDVDETYFDEIVNTNYKGLYFTVQRSLVLLLF